MTDAPPPASAAFTIATELRALIGTLRRKVAAKGNAADLTPSQLTAVLRLEHDGAMTTSSLARAEAMRPQSMASIVRDLTRMKFIAGSPDPSDGRQTLFSLTDTARQWLIDGRAARQDWLAHALDEKLSPAEQAQLLTAIGLLKRLVDD